MKLTIKMPEWKKETLEAFMGKKIPDAEPIKYWVDESGKKVLIQPPNHTTKVEEEMSPFKTGVDYSSIMLQASAMGAEVTVHHVTEYDDFLGKQQMATEYAIDGFYKSGEVRLYQKMGGKLLCLSRYDNAHDVDTLEDLVLVNFQWWLWSKSKHLSWNQPDPVWLPKMIEMGLVVVAGVQTNPLGVVSKYYAPAEEWWGMSEPAKQLKKDWVWEPPESEKKMPHLMMNLKPKKPKLG